MRENYKNIFTFLILIFFVVGFSIFNSVGTYTNDDLWAGFFYTKSIVRNILYSDQGMIWSHNFEKFIIHALPSVLHMHPQQNIIVAIVKSIDFALFALLLSLFFNPIIKKIPNPILVLMNIWILLCVLFLLDIVGIVHIMMHIKYIFNLTICGYIWYIWINEFLNDQFLSKKNVIRNCIFAVILVFCGHIVNIPTVIFFASLFLYEVFKTKDYFLNLKKSIPVIMPFIIIYAICFFMYLNFPLFVHSRVTRLPSEPLFMYTVTHFWDFTKKLFENIFSNRYICSVLLLNIAGFIGAFFARKKIDKRYFVIAGAIFLANFVFQYSLILCGTTYYDKVSYWFKSDQLQALFVFYLLLSCNILFGCLYRCINKPKFKTVFILCSFLIINLIFPINIVCKNLKMVYDNEIIQRAAIYKTNKIYRYYSLKGKHIYMPFEYYKQVNMFYWLVPPELYIGNLDFIYKNIPNDKKYDIIDKKITNEDELFTKEEIEHINFKKLYDNDFILQMKEPKYE